MPAARELSGQKFGRLTVERRTEHRKSDRAVFWDCICDCGNKISVDSYSLTSGNSRSCGCVRKELFRQRATKHGMSKTNIYNIWSSMIERCHTTPHKNYGLRGIVVCDRWRTSFENFYADMGDRPSLKHSIDRIDNNGPYSPENCRWATRAQQHRNTRQNVYITVNGETKVLSDWMKHYGLNRSSVYRWFRKGYSFEQILLKACGIDQSKT